MRSPSGLVIIHLCLLFWSQLSAHNLIHRDLLTINEPIRTNGYRKDQRTNLGWISTKQYHIIYGRR